MMTLKEALKKITDTYIAAGLKHRQESYWLLEQIVHKNKAYILSHPQTLLDQEEKNKLENWLHRRVAGEPLAYLTGTAPFFDFDLKVNLATLIPRPETELLCEVAENILVKEQVNRVVFDYGTGSGAIAIFLAKTLSQHTIWGIDFSADALCVAKENGAIHQAKVHWCLSDWSSLIPEEIRPWMIVSNPPYIDKDDKHLEKDGVRHEPRTALVAQDAGMACFKAIIKDAKQRLLSDGWLILEHGFTQQEELAHTLTENGFQVMGLYQDDAGLPRVIAATKK